MQRVLTDSFFAGTFIGFGVIAKRFGYSATSKGVNTNADMAAKGQRGWRDALEILLALRRR